MHIADANEGCAGSGLPGVGTHSAVVMAGFTGAIDSGPNRMAMGVTAGIIPEIGAMAIGATAAAAASEGGIPITVNPVNPGTGGQIMTVTTIIFMGALFGFDCALGSNDVSSMAGITGSYRGYRKTMVMGMIGKGIGAVAGRTGADGIGTANGGIIIHGVNQDRGANRNQIDKIAANQFMTGSARAMGLDVTGIYIYAGAGAGGGGMAGLAVYFVINRSAMVAVMTGYAMAVGADGAVIEQTAGDVDRGIIVMNTRRINGATVVMTGRTGCVPGAGI